MKTYDKTEQFEDDLFYIDTRAHGMNGSIGVLAYKSGGENVIFDAGMPNSASEILLSLRKLSINTESTRYVLLSHRHIDHAGGAFALLEQLPNASVGLHPFSVKGLSEPSKIYEGGRELFGDFATPMGPVQTPSMQSLEDGEEIRLGEGVVRAIYSPGHTSDHIAYYIPQKRTLYCGDVLGSFSVKTAKMHPTSIYPSFDYAKYKTTISKMRSIDADVAVFSHFGVISGVDINQILDMSLAAYRALEEFVAVNSSSMDKEKLVRELKATLKEATEIFPGPVRDKAAEFIARGFLEGSSPSKMGQQ